jgi:hypothetical protein
VNLLRSQPHNFLGNSNRAFVGKVLKVVNQNNDFLPRSFNVEQLCADLATCDCLSSLAMSMTQLCDWMDATVIAIGTQVYEQSLVAYHHARAIAGSKAKAHEASVVPSSQIQLNQSLKASDETSFFHLKSDLGLLLRLSHL